MKHAMIMTIHSNIEMLRMFVDLFDDERYDFYILVDKKSTLSDEEMSKIQAKKSKIVFLPRINIFWAGYSQIDAYLGLLSESRKGDYDYYHFFQGSDFPLKTKDEVDAFFEKNKGKEFINFYKDDFSDFKCAYRHFFVERASYRSSKILKLMNHSLIKLQKLFRIRRNQDIDMYQGSALSSVTAECADYILAHREEIERRFGSALGADEVFLQTMVANSPFKDRVYRFDNSSYANARFIDWERREGSSPYTFLLDDYDELINAGEGLCFCRKITEQRSMELVNKLYEYLKNRENFKEN